jgi:ankyrin repeat protein
MLQLILILFYLLLLCQYIATSATGDDDSSVGGVFDQFLMACSHGNMEIVEKVLQEHPDYAVGQSQNGESCLHVAGILGQVNVTQFILQHGGNPNQRSTYEHGLRMTPLAWNVYGKHVANVELLLAAGANVNLDFDYLSNGKHEVVTVLDLLHIIERFGDDENNNTADDNSTDEDRSPYAMRDLLLKYGAKRFKDLQGATEL